MTISFSVLKHGVGVRVSRARARFEIFHTSETDDLRTIYSYLTI